MSNVKIIGPNVPNMPWQDRPAQTCADLPVWRYSENPIIGRNPAKGVARIFNSAVMPYGDGFIGVFRENKQTVFPISILAGAKTPFIGNLMKRRFLLKMRKAMILCPGMHMTQDL